jgi:uncharacterized protein involved in exopolysaccharide biosynthesis
MDGEFDALDFAIYARDRWLVVALACGIAVFVAFGISKLLPRKYTATASVLIALPGGNDPRAATAVSPVYLESLKAFERYASSDTLFARAMDAVHAGDGGPVESIKNRVLKVSKPATTAVLEISATLGDAKKAQALAQYVAEQTVELNRSLQVQSSADLVNEFRSQLSAAKARYEGAEHARDAFAATHPIESLENEVQNASELKLRLERDIEVARTDVADYAAQHESGARDTQTSSTQAKIASLEGQMRELAAVLAEKGAQLEERKVRSDALENDARSALMAFDKANTALNEMLSTSLTHGERLQIIDPGIVPQQPSSPNTILNVIAALLLSFVGSIVWLGFRFGHTRLLSVRSEHAFRHGVR